MQRWLILTATLPTSPSALRVRVWRALKATGAGTLREGVYLLPEHAATAAALWSLERTIVEAGAEAHMLVLLPRDAAQEAAFRGLFDRSAAYAELMRSIKETLRTIRGASEAQLHKALRALDQQLDAIAALDFFPGKAHGKAAGALAALHRKVALHLSPDEPATSDSPVAPRRIDDHQQRVWATRRRPWVDRLATAWLIQRFIDRAPRFLWLSSPKKCPKTALGFDFDGATFTHVADKVTFEVVATSFGLDDDPGLRRFGALVHSIDVGGLPIDEAAGFELLVRGLQATHADDDALLAAAMPLFDACYTALRTLPDEHTPA